MTFREKSHKRVLLKMMSSKYLLYRVDVLGWALMLFVKVTTVSEQSKPRPSFGGSGAYGAPCRPVSLVGDYLSRRDDLVGSLFVSTDFVTGGLRVSYST